MPPTLLAQLTGKISKLWQSGFVVDATTWRYLDHTFYDPSPESIAQKLHEESDCEIDSLIELLFYPTEDMQIEVEPLLQSATLSHQDSSDLIHTLASLNLDTVLYFIDCDRAIKTAMPALAIRQFVTRLNLTYSPPVAVTNAVNKFLPETHRNSTKVRLRNANLALSSHQAELLIRFFAKIDHQRTNYWDCFEYLLKTLPEVTPATQSYEFLIEKKKFYSQAVAKSEKFLERFHRSNMETLMLQGERAAYIHPEEGRSIIALIDQICWVLFGKSDHFQRPQNRVVDLEPLDSPERLTKVIKHLS